MNVGDLVAPKWSLYYLDDDLEALDAMNVGDLVAPKWSPSDGSAVAKMNWWPGLVVGKVSKSELRSVDILCADGLVRRMPGIWLKVKYEHWRG